MTMSEKAAARVPPALDRGSDRLGSGLAREVLDLADDLALSRLLAQDEPGDGDDQDQPG
jgi:hypothetical protein